MLRILLACSLCSYATSLTAEELPSKITSYGVEYPAACSPDELARLKGEVFKVAGKRKREEAWNLIDALMCKSGADAEKYVSLHMPEKIHREHGETGDPEAARPKRELVAGNAASVMIAGKTWGADAKAGKRGRLVVSFNQEVCVGSYDLAYRRGRWLLVEQRGFCD